MPLNEDDRLEVLTIQKRIHQLEQWMRFCLDELHKENIKLLNKVRD